jgi:hypothetical protein
MSVAQVVDAAISVTDALAYAHERGVLHRDIKPENVLVRDSAPPLTNSYVLADFGTARLAGAEATRSVRECTYLYASPQVFAGERPSVADDIWGIGATLFTLLDGAPPFTPRDDPEAGTDLPSYSYRVVSGVPRALRARAVPRPFAEIIRRCLAKVPDDRFASVADLRTALGQMAPGAGLVGSGPVRSTEPATWDLGEPAADSAPAHAHAPTDTGVPVNQAATDAVPGPPRRSRLRTVLIGVSVAVAVVLAVAAGAFVPRFVGGAPVAAGAGRPGSSGAPSDTGSATPSPPASASATPTGTPVVSAGPPVPVRGTPVPPTSSTISTPPNPPAGPSAVVYHLAGNTLSPQLRDGACTYLVFFGNYSSFAYAKIRFYNGDCGQTTLVVTAARGAVITQEAARGQEPSTGTDSCGEYYELQATSNSEPAVAIGMRIQFGVTGDVVTFAYDHGDEPVAVGPC